MSDRAATLSYYGLLVTGPLVTATGDALGIGSTAQNIWSIANFGSYNKTYGSLGGFVALLVWMCISNLSLLFGFELNSGIEHDRRLKID